MIPSRAQYTSGPTAQCAATNSGKLAGKEIGGKPRGIAAVAAEVPTHRSIASGRLPAANHTAGQERLKKLNA
jgi:hypothetical protein